ncbi:MAG: spermidine/putrescine ABC transporter substrate-binding protein [Oscillospiraceae bacterium]
MLKKIVSLCLVLSFAMAFFTVPLFAKDNVKTTLKVYNWGEYISDGADETMDVIAEFEKHYPDIDVDYQTFGTNEEMYAKIASGSAEYDVIIPSDYMISKMIKGDLLAKIDYNNIPNYMFIDREFKNLEFDPKNEYSVPYTWGTVGIIYNKKMVSEKVDSWDMLWNEKYKNKILMFNNSRDAYGIALKKLGYSQNTTNKDEIDQATELLKEQKTVIKSYVMDEIFDKMTIGEAALAPYYAGDAITMIKDNPDLAFVVPKEGSNKFVDSMVIAKSSKNKAIAETFIDFMLEPEVAKANIEYIGYSTPMSLVRDMLDKNLRESPISYPESEVLARCDTFLDLPEETNEYISESWNDVMAYGSNNVVTLIILVVIVLAIAAGVIFLFIKRKNSK